MKNIDLHTLKNRVPQNGKLPTLEQNMERAVFLIAHFARFWIPVTR
jgi:hypothetical protein